MERSEKEKRAFRNRVDAMAIKVKAQRDLDEQTVPSNQKKYRANIEETKILLDAGAEIIECQISNERTFIRLMYEAIPIEYEEDSELIHPRLSNATKKAG